MALREAQPSVWELPTGSASGCSPEETPDPTRSSECCPDCGELFWLQGSCQEHWVPTFRRDDGTRRWQVVDSNPSPKTSQAWWSTNTGRLMPLHHEHALEYPQSGNCLELAEHWHFSLQRQVAALVSSCLISPHALSSETAWCS